MAAAKSQGWKIEQASVVAAYDPCGSASWETLPDGVTTVPCAWLPSDSLASTGVSDAEVVAAGELTKCEAVAKNRTARPR